MKNKIFLIIGILILGLSFLLSGTAQKGSADLKINGDIQLDLPDSQVTMSYMKRIRIWQIGFSTSSVDYKKKGRKGTAHLFFSRNFILNTGKYPIAFSYLNKKNIMGGTFFYRELGKRTVRFTYDTKGEVIFTKVGDIIEGKFSFTVFSSGKEPRKSVLVSGEFKVPKGVNFPDAPAIKK